MPATTRTYTQGDVLFTEGIPSQSLFVIHKGSVELRKKKEGGYVRLAQIYSNEVLGELSYFDKKPRSATAVALTEVEASEITFDSMDKLLKKVPPYFKTIVMGLAERLRKADDVIKKLQKQIITDDGEKEPIDPEGDINLESILHDDPGADDSST